LYFTFYIDQFFLEQLLVGTLLLALARDLRRSLVPWRNILAGSLANAGIVTFLVWKRLLFLSPVGLLAAGAITAVPHSLRSLISQIRMLLILTVCFGGLMSATLALSDLPWTVSAVLSGLLIGAAGRQLMHQRGQAGLVTVHLCSGEKQETVKALIDTGNQLSEPCTGRPVSILDASCAGTLLEKDWEKQRGFFLIPYHSIGQERGLLQGVTIDRMMIEDGRRPVTEVDHPLVAIYQGYVSAQRSYQMILHPEHAALNRME
jgi:sigma-E processing peptidase SpoIIGA